MKKMKWALLMIISTFSFMFFTYMPIKAENVTFDLKEKGVEVQIDDEKYTSDDDHLIIVPKNENGIYRVTTALLKEKEYTYTEEQMLTNIDLILPREIVLNENNIYLSTSSVNWLVQAQVLFYDDSSLPINLSINLNNMNSNELVFYNVLPIHADYNILDTITLERITSEMENYKDAYIALENASSNFKQFATDAKNKLESLDNIYTEGNVSADSIEYYQRYLTRNNIDRNSLNDWLSNIVDTIELGNSQLSVIYGDNVSTNVVVNYLIGSESIKVDFDYTLDDISENSVKISSIGKFTLIKKGKTIYEDYLSYNVDFVKRKLHSNVVSYSAIYNGTRQDIDINVANVSDKFNDSISNKQVVYLIDDVEVEPIFANTYKIILRFNITNREYYDISEFIINDYIIEKAMIDNINFTNKTFSYNGDRVNFGVDNITLSDGSEANVIYYIDDNEIESLINANTYDVKAIITNDNYKTLELFARIVIEKSETTLNYDTAIIVSEFDENDFNYRMRRVVFEDGRIAKITYKLYKNNRIIDRIYGVGRYRVEATIEDNGGNYNSKVVNANIEITPKKIQVNYSNEKYIYNGLSQGPTISSSYDLSVIYDDVSNIAPINAGNHVVEVRTIDYNYIVTNNTYEFNIEPVKVVFEDFANLEVEYCNCNFVESVKISNKYGNDEVESVLGYSFDNQVVNNIIDANKTYVVKVIGLTGKDALNYSIDGVSNKITVKVNPKKIYITPLSNITKLYSEEDPVIGYDMSSEVYEENDIFGSLSREVGENVGKYKILKGTLDATSNYKLIIGLNNAYFKINPKPIKVAYLYRRLVYDGKEKELNINIDGDAHIEHEKIVDAGTYYIKVVVDSPNYVLSDNYKDIEVEVEKLDISDRIQLEQDVYIYNGANPQIVLENGYNFNVEFYSKYNEKLEEAIMPGDYIAKIMVNEKNYTSNKDFKIKIDKMAHVLEKADIEAFYNKIVVEKTPNYEYKINNGEYSSSNEFHWLDALTDYKISVRVKEDEIGYASSPKVYIVRTTRNPETANNLINILPNNISEYGMITLKSINEYMKDTNEKDLDQVKLEKYKLVKERYDNVLEGYRDDINDVNEISKSISYVYSCLTITLLTIAAFVLLKKFIYIF